MSDDPFGIADEIPDLVEAWDPDTKELPAEATAEEWWLHKRQIAREFTNRELERQRAQFDRTAERLKKRRTEVLEPLERDLASLDGQLIQYLKAKEAEARHLGLKIPSAVETPHGTIKSDPPRPKQVVEIVDEARALIWLKANDMDDMIRTTKPKVPTEHVDKVKIRKAVRGDRVATPDGEPTDHLKVVNQDRKYSVIDPAREHE